MSMFWHSIFIFSAAYHNPPKNKLKMCVHNGYFKCKILKYIDTYSGKRKKEKKGRAKNMDT